jgi:OOP family OmpA-OmpF porin
MKKNLLTFTLGLFLSTLTYAQNDSSKKDKELKEIEPDQEIVYDSYNKWSIELEAGQSKGTKPYAVGYYYSNPNKHFAFEFNHFAIGGRYMISPTFGVRAKFAYDNLSNLSGSESLPFEMEQIQASFEGVVNTVRLFNIEEKAGRFGLLVHLGFQGAQMTPKMGINEGKHEFNVGLVGGFTPQFRVLKNVSVFADFTINSNVRQHFNWDGSYSESNNNLTGSMYSTSLGVSISFGAEKIHGDWAIIEDKKSKEMRELEARVGDIETLMNDTDKDGVPDYLDQENNSIAGVAVDTKGRMVDLNNNGVPDELEKYVDKSVTNNISNNKAEISNGMLLQLINDGYIAAYFDTDKRVPTTASTDNIGFILNYLRSNPTKSVDIIGYADAIGKSNYNTKLSNDRAENVKTILIKAGIDSSRLNIVGNGIDDSVDRNSEYARRLVRKVVFKVK